jgi:hypothetical protein
MMAMGIMHWRRSFAIVGFTLAHPPFRNALIGRHLSAASRAAE